MNLFVNKKSTERTNKARIYPCRCYVINKKIIKNANEKTAEMVEDFLSPKFQFSGILWLRYCYFVFCRTGFFVVCHNRGGKQVVFAVVVLVVFLVIVVVRPLL
jgi:glucan phosphoethanolaminetransferase (alkaline phosphatase superfamily)